MHPRFACSTSRFPKAPLFPSFSPKHSSKCQLFCVTGGSGAGGIPGRFGCAASITFRRRAGATPYVPVQLDILISRGFSYHLLKHWVITRAKWPNLSLRQRSVVLDSFMGTFTTAEPCLCLVWWNFPPPAGEIPPSQGNSKPHTCCYTPAPWSMSCLRGKVLFQGIYFLKYCGIFRLWGAILGRGFGVGHSALLVSIIPSIEQWCFFHRQGGISKCCPPHLMGAEGFSSRECVQAESFRLFFFSRSGKGFYSETEN